MFALQNMFAQTKRIAPPKKGLPNPQKFCTSQKMFVQTKKVRAFQKIFAHTQKAHGSQKMFAQTTKGMRLQENIGASINMPCIP
jgi:hypothetical protein